MPAVACASATKYVFEFSGSTKNPGQVADAVHWPYIVFCSKKAKRIPTDAGVFIFSFVYPLVSLSLCTMCQWSIQYTSTLVHTQLYLTV